MDRWGVLVWNMGLGSPGARSAKRNMAYLWELHRKYAVRVALLNEANVVQLKAANDAAEKEGRPRPFVFSEEGTIGRDFWADKQGVRKPYDRKRWSAAVMSPLGPELLGEDDVRARRPYGNKPVDIKFTNSRPGTWIAAMVPMGKEAVTCVSLYGLASRRPRVPPCIAPCPRSAQIFSDPKHNEFVLLGGHFNVSTGLASPSARERSRIVLDRIKAYGLVDCLAEWRESTVRTSGKRDMKTSKESPVQVDYLFASEALAGRLVEVIDIPLEEWERFSDHGPIVASFRGRARRTS